jgi:hypothetical protein
MRMDPARPSTAPTDATSTRRSRSAHTGLAGETPGSVAASTGSSAPTVIYAMVPDKAALGAFSHGGTRWTQPVSNVRRVPQRSIESPPGPPEALISQCDRHGRDGTGHHEVMMTNQ